MLAVVASGGNGKCKGPGGRGQSCWYGEGWDGWSSLQGVRPGVAW